MSNIKDEKFRMLLRRKNFKKSFKNVKYSSSKYGFGADLIQSFLCRDLVLTLESNYESLWPI